MGSGGGHQGGLVKQATIDFSLGRELGVTEWSPELGSMLSREGA